MKKCIKIVIGIICMSFLFLIIKRRNYVEDMNLIINKSKNDNEDYFNHDSRTLYDDKKYDIEYHIPSSELEGSSNGSWLLNKGKVEYYPWSKMTNEYTYNTKNFYKYGNSTYVPSYEDSIYLSRTGSV